MLHIFRHGRILGFDPWSPKNSVQKRSRCAFSEAHKIRKFRNIPVVFGKMYIYIHVWEYACYQICTYMLGQNYIYIIYICMHVTACIFGWHIATSLIENLGNNSAFPNSHVSLPTGVSHQLIMVEEVPSSVISPSNLCTKNRICLKPVQRMVYKVVYEKKS